MSAEPASERRLTDDGYWDGVHATEAQAWSGTRLRSRLKARLGPRLRESMRAYEDYLLWDVILPPYLEGRRGQAAVEIGSAPGSFLTQLHERFGLVPYGIEYSPPGAELNRRLFASHGIDPGNVIEADFFDPGLHQRHRERFDVVLSRGFIEHFADPEGAVRKHLDLLRPGGLLMVSVPNLRGLNLALAWLLHREVVAMHNLEIMARPRFAALFPADLVEPLFCGYYGTFSFCLFNVRPGSLMRLPLAAGLKAQVALNALFRGLLKDRGAESAWFSPNLLFVGIKR